MRFALILLVCLAALLSGCPAAPGRATAIQRAKPLAHPGEKVTPGALPAGWPDFLPAYPAGKLVEGRELHSAGVTTLTAVQTSADEPQKCVDFYSQRASNYGYKILTSSSAQGALSSVYKHDADSLLISVARPTAQPTSRIVLKLARPDEQAAEAASAPSSPAASPAPPGQAAGSVPPAGAPKQAAGDSGEPLLAIYPGSQADPLRHEKDGKLALRLVSADDPKKISAFYNSFYVGHGFHQTYSIESEEGLSLGYESKPESIDITIGPLKGSVGQNVVWVVLGNGDLPALPK